MILAEIPSQPFRDLVVFAWETGARAAEYRAIEKRHVDLANHRIVFPVEEEKMRRITGVHSWGTYRYHLRLWKTMFKPGWSSSSSGTNTIRMRQPA